ncbi:transporter substrate-binding domain-containing protein [Kocuria carniphila]|uniref:Transporter substrate-binding domain-containing protein n=1 Tax=Kocuria carniphila TaxID=262208 RepID=A0ABV3V3X1_9MICC|nr:transporter substrate-binding domain-containing protein [Kocuria sp. cx-455]MBD2765707.1 transporter substrate-binding domain-containing protein [Kocuria sp. cx-455]
MRYASRWLMVLLVLVFSLTGCVTHYPTDPHGTLDRVSGGVLRVGAIHNEPYVSVTDGEPTGEEVRLVEDFATALDARIEWTTASEEHLVTEMEHGQLDLLVGGMTMDTQWQQKVGLTRPYNQTTNEYGETEKHVMAVANGENAFLLKLDQFLQGSGDQS